MRLSRRRVLCLLGLLGLASLVFCMLQTLQNDRPKVPLRRIQDTRWGGHQGPLLPHSKSKTKRLNSMEIMESNLSHKLFEAKPARKKTLKAVVRILGNDNDIVQLPEAAPTSELRRKAKSSLQCPQLGQFDSLDLLKELTSSALVTWFSQKDKELMRFLTQGSVQKIQYLTRRRQMVQVILATNTPFPVDGSGDQCKAGACALVKDLTNLNEVVAFHLDRILGLNVSQPVVSRQLTSWLMPHRYIDDHPRPVVRWDPSISLPQGANRYQDAYFARMVQYPSIFRQCGTESDGVCHQHASPELKRIKLLDYFLQDNKGLETGVCNFAVQRSDRLYSGRSCSDLSQEGEMLPSGSDDKNDQNAVTFASSDWLSPKALEVISSECLPGLLVLSLYQDREYWHSKSLHEMGNLADRIGKRADVFLKQIQESQQNHKKALV
eukprot:gi/632978243/ref/XP_007905799.1/ PREDICTED: protein FAM198A-like [Callorhinchus milii]